MDESGDSLSKSIENFTPFMRQESLIAKQFKVICVGESMVGKTSLI